MNPISRRGIFQILAAAPIALCAGKKIAKASGDYPPAFLQESTAPPDTIIEVMDGGILHNCRIRIPDGYMGIYYDPKRGGRITNNLVLPANSKDQKTA